MTGRMDAYAKINLALDVTGVRADGYHMIRTVLQSVSLSDQVSLAETRSEKTEISCGAELPCDRSNTVYRAAEAFFLTTGICNDGVLFSLKKEIPWQAGLGGGSADAAAALKLLNQKYGHVLSERQLCKTALSVGADVPFCLLGGTAIGEGIGEKLTPLPPMPDCLLVICKPAGGVSTREAYTAIDRENRCRATEYTDRVLQALKSRNLTEIGRALGNVFELVSGLSDLPVIRGIMISSGALGACMTGSGSAIFGIFDSEEKAHSCYSGLLQQYPQSFLCRPVSRKTSAPAGFF